MSLCRMPVSTPPPGKGRRLWVLCGLALWLWAAPPARAQGIELTTLQLARQGGELTLDFAVQTRLPPAVQDALQRGVPVYFVAQASLYRSRWYWRDERVARVRRTWRIAYQPLTSSWRVSLGALGQSAPTLADALAIASAAARWKLADLSQLVIDDRYYVEFVYRLDTRQVPSPMQINLTGASDWALRVERTIPI